MEGHFLQKSETGLKLRKRKLPSFCASVFLLICPETDPEKRKSWPWRIQFQISGVWLLIIFELSDTKSYLFYYIIVHKQNVRSHHPGPIQRGQSVYVINGHLCRQLHLMELTKIYLRALRWDLIIFEELLKNKLHSKIPKNCKITTDK